MQIKILFKKKYIIILTSAVLLLGALTVVIVQINKLSKEDNLKHKISSTNIEQKLNNDKKEEKKQLDPVSSVEVLNKNNDVPKEEKNKSPEETIVNKVGNSSFNLANAGYAAVQGDWVYYVTYENKKFNLYKIKKDNTEKIKIDSSDYSICELNVIGNWIYCIDGSGVCKIKTDGSNKTPLTGYAQQFMLENDWIYYNNMNSLYKMKIDGTGNTLMLGGSPETKGPNIFESFNVSSVIGDWIYYLYTYDSMKNPEKDICAIYKIKTDGTGNVKIKDLKPTSSFITVNDGWFYYREDNMLYQMKEDGSNNKMIYNEPMTSLNIVNGWIYYSNQTVLSNNKLIKSNDERMYKIRIDGTEKVKLFDYENINLNVIDDWIYFNSTKDGDITFYKMKIDGTNLTKL